MEQRDVEKLVSNAQDDFLKPPKVTQMFDQSRPKSRTYASAPKTKDGVQLLSDTLLIHQKGYRMMRSELQLLQELVGKGVHETMELNITIDRLYERFEVLIQEQRTTNLLLSQLIGIHSQIGGYDPEKATEFGGWVREAAYERVARGE